jgi:hypothetical protein
MLGGAAPAACVDLSGNGLAPTIWETQLIPATSHPGLAGQAAAVSDRSGTDLGIGISGAVVGAQHLWSLRLGGCALPGQQVGADSDYPVLVVSDSATASAETQLGPQLIRSGAYHVAVRVSAADTTRIACGDLAVR